MKFLNIFISLTVAIFFSACAHADKAKNAVPAQMEIIRSGTQPSSAGPKEYFDGSVRVDPVYKPRPELQSSASYVTFEKGARSAWHTHPNGQTLVVTDGVGRVQEWGGAVQTIRKGDVIWTPPGVKHWHGASEESSMTHLSIIEALKGKSVDWLEKVTND